MGRESRSGRSQSNVWWAGVFGTLDHFASVVPPSTPVPAGRLTSAERCDECFAERVVCGWVLSGDQ